MESMTAHVCARSKNEDSAATIDNDRQSTPNSPTHESRTILRAQWQVSESREGKRVLRWKNNEEMKMIEHGRGHSATIPKTWPRSAATSDILKQPLRVLKYLRLLQYVALGNHRQLTPHRLRLRHVTPHRQRMQLRLYLRHVTPHH